MEGQNNSLWGVIRQHFNSLPDKNEERDTIIQITDGISFKGSNLWILIFAILIASLGLNVNSTAVIIGAMLISPLMGPITGMGLSIGINDLQFLKRSFKNYLIMVVIAVITATLYFLITPLKEAQSELLSRTSPTLYDVLIAICGGAAGIIALSTKGKELRSLYPNVTSISLSKVMEVTTDTSATKRYVVAIVGSKTNFSTADRERLSRWLKSRTESDSLRLITTR